MCKMSNILLVVASMFVLVAGDCMQKIQDIEKKTNGRPLMGGYRRMEDPQNNTVAVNIVADAVKAYNERSNDMLQYKDNGGYVCYSQLVNGENYCCGHQIKSDGCKNEVNSEYCEKETKKACTVEAHKLFPEQYATINPESVQCTNVVEP